MAFDRIAVVGAGAWGTALANAIARAGRAVLLAARDRAGADMLVKTRVTRLCWGPIFQNRWLWVPAFAGTTTF